MTDRLRLRPGMRERMAARPGASALGEDFAQLCQDEALLARLESQVGSMCLRTGIQVQKAF